MDVDILNTVLESLLGQIAYAYGNLLPVSYYIFVSFASIQFAKLGLSYALGQSHNVISDLIVQIIKIGFLCWVVTNLPYIHEVLRDTAIKLGIKAAGSSNTIDLILNPSLVVGYGFEISKPIFNWLNGLSWSFGKAGTSFTSSMIGLITCFIVIGSFAYMAFQIFMTLIDFYLSSVLSVIFLAFNVFGPTKWISTGAIRGPLQHLVKLFTLAFVVSLTPFLLERLVNDVADIGTQGAVCLALASLIVSVLTIKAGSFASGMISGSPTTGASDLFSVGAGFAAGGAATAIASKTLSSQATRGAISAGGALISGASAAFTGGRVGSTEYNGSSSFGKTLAFSKGAFKGASSSALAYPSSLKDRVVQGFNNSVNSGVIRGYNAATENNSPIKDFANKAQIYQRVSRALKEKQDLEK